MTGIHGIVAIIDSEVYGVVLDKHIDGCHNLSNDDNPNGVCPDGYGWWLWKSELELEPSEAGASDTVSFDEEAFNYGS